MVFFTPSSLCPSKPAISGTVRFAVTSKKTTPGHILTRSAVMLVSQQVVDEVGWHLLRQGVLHDELDAQHFVKFAVGVQTLYRRLAGWVVLGDITEREGEAALAT